MSSLPTISSLRKGALIQGNSIIPFQYTPEKLVRTLTANALSAGSTQMTRIKGPPAEQIDLGIMIDATDQLERGSGLTAALGIYPTLSALEMLLYPSSARILANAALGALGVIEIIPPLPSLTVLVWGLMRVVPVEISTFTVTEEQFDESLTPIRANISLGLKVLNYQDLGLVSVGGMLSMVNHVGKEALSYMGATPVLGGGTSLVGSALSGINWGLVGSAMSNLG